MSRCSPINSVLPNMLSAVGEVIAALMFEPIFFTKSLPMTPPTIFLLLILRLLPTLRPFFLFIFRDFFRKMIDFCNNLRDFFLVCRLLPPLKNPPSGKTVILVLPSTKLLILSELFKNWEIAVVKFSENLVLSTSTKLNNFGNKPFLI